MSKKEIEEAASVHNVHSILKRNGANQKMNGIENNADEKIVYTRSRSSSDPIEPLDHSIHRKAKIVSIRKDSLQVNNSSYNKNDSKNHPRFGEIIEICNEVDDDSLEAVSRKTSDFITTDEHLKVAEPVNDAIPEKKEMTLLEVLEQLKRITLKNRNQISENIVLILLVLLMLVPSILFAIFNEPDDPYQYAMTSYATVWPLKQKFVINHAGSQLQVNWGNTIPHLSGVPTMCKNKKPWCYSWSHNSFLLLTPMTPIAGIDCVRFDWQNLTSQPVQFSDCFSSSNTSSYWYGGPVGLNTVWPANDQAAAIGPVNILTGDVQTSLLNLYGVQEPFWVSNEGFAILISKRYSVSINQNNTEICINSDPYVGRLQYAACRGADPTLLVLQRKTIETVFNAMPPPTTSTKNDHVSNEIEVETEIYTDLAYNIKNETFFNIIVALDATNLINENFTRLIDSMTLYNLSFVVMFENFDFFDIDMSSELMQILNETNLSSLYPTAVEASSYVKVDLGNFNMLFWEKLCVNQKATGTQNPNAPNPLGTVIWRDHLYFAIDFTLIEVQDKFTFTVSIEPITKLVQYLSFTGGTASELPVQAQLNITHDNWNVYSTMFTECVASIPGVISIATGYNTQKIKNLHIDIPVTSENVSSIIPVFLTLNMQGYSYLSLHLFDPDSDSTSGTDTGNSTQHLTQWLQVAMHLPVFRVPFELLQTDVFLTVYQKYGAIRRDTVLPHYVNATINYDLHGQPILKPMWWFGDNQHDSWTNNNQYMIGDNLLVAAFLAKHNFKVYLPKGTWHDPTVPSVCHEGGSVIALHNPVDIMCFERVFDPDSCVYQ